MDDSKLRYKGICPECGTVLWICPSLAMLNGWHNDGHGTCFRCGKFLHLTFDIEKKEFTTATWERYQKLENEKYAAGKDLGNRYNQ
ncbi:MAG: hypothetical protein RR496_06040 [Lachnospiraceae bacterium]